MSFCSGFHVNITKQSNLVDKVERLHSAFQKLIESLNVINYTNPSSNPNIQANQDKIQKMHKRILSVLDKVADQDLEHRSWMLSNVICEYCKDINGGRDALIENKIIKNYELANEYAQDVLSENDRWEEYENELINSSCEDKEKLDWMYSYASTLNSRWESYEKFILEKGEKAYKDKEKFASILLGYCRRFSFRWQEAEKFIMLDASFCVQYADEVIGGRWVEAESSILKSMDAAFEYLSKLKFRWPEYERKIKKRSRRILSYAKEVIHGKLPDELHNRMLMYGMMNVKTDEYSPDKAHSEDYFEFLKSAERNAILFLKSIDEEERKKILAQF